MTTTQGLKNTMPTTGDDSNLIVKILAGIAAIVTTIGAPFAWVTSRLDKKASKASLDKLEEDSKISVERLEEDMDKKLDETVFNEFKHTNGLAHDITHSGIKEIKNTIITQDKKYENIIRQLFDKLDGKRDKE